MQFRGVLRLIPVSSRFSQPDPPVPRGYLRFKVVVGLCPLIEIKGKR